VDEQTRNVPGDEVRTRKLVVVDNEGTERAVLTTRSSYIELRLNAGPNYELLLFAGEHEPGLFALGIEFWANGESLGGASLTVQGGNVDFHRFP
jgi:hypothetical protein